MELFAKRPFCFFCFLFLLCSVLCCRLPAQVKLILLIACGALLFCCLLLCILWRRHRLRLLYLLLCVAFVFLSLGNQWLFVDRAREDALSHTGSHIVSGTVLAVEYEGERSAEYLLELRDVDGTSVRLRSLLITAFPAELKAGDRVAVDAYLMAGGSETMGLVPHTDEKTYLQAVAYQEEQVALIERGVFHPQVLLSQWREALSSRMHGLLGEELGSMSTGFLLGDTDSISPVTLRDFRRCGVSHLLAVSGLHTSVILGSIELLLRKLSVRRTARCILLSVFAVVFLALTGFSASAYRSVWMLLMVYAAYLFLREYDSVTALFGAAFLILLFSPHAVTDIGLWLSFFATLGILVAYPVVISLWRRLRGKRLWRRVLTAVLGSVAMTVICNIFTLFILWIAFGEISLVAVLANPILAPLGSLFLIGALLCLALGGIPILGYGICFLVSGLGALMTHLASLFSSVNGAMISLRYPFAAWILLPMTATLAVLLVIRLRRKWMLLLPAVAAIVCFSVCLLTYAWIERGRIRAEYLAEGDNEALLLTDHRVSAICDISQGSFSLWNTACEIAAEYAATEIDAVVLTHYHNGHISALDRLCRTQMVRRICLPMPQTDADRACGAQILEMGTEYGVEICVYEPMKEMALCSDAWIRCLPIANGADATHPMLGFCVGSGEDMIAYFGEGYWERTADGRTAAIGEAATGVIFGAHGPATDDALALDASQAAFLLFAHERIYERWQKQSPSEAAVCLADEESRRGLIRFRFVMEESP